MYQGGVWLKKKSVLSAENNYNVERSADRMTDLRVTYKAYSSVPSQNLPLISSKDNYFYLPALGAYIFGPLRDLGKGGYYWTSSAFPTSNIGAYNLYFDKSSIDVADYDGRNFGLSVQSFN